MMTKDQIKEYRVYIGLWIRMLGYTSALMRREDAEKLEIEPPDDIYNDYFKVLLCFKPNGGWGSYFLNAGAYDHENEVVIVDGARLKILSV